MARYGRRLVATTVFLDPDQVDQLKQLGAITNRTVAEYIRDGVDQVLAAELATGGAELALEVAQPEAERPCMASEVMPAPNAAALSYVANLASRESRRSLKGCLERIAKLLTDGKRDAMTFPWGELRALHTQAVRAALVARGYAPATANVHLAALRGVLKSAWLLGHIPTEEFNRAIKIEPVRGEREPAGRQLAADELAAVFMACHRDPSAAGRRDAAAHALLYQGALRCAELAALDVAGVDAGGVRFIGKGNKEAYQPIVDEGRAALDAWLAVRGDAPGPVICRIRSNGRIEPGARLSERGIRYMVERRADQAGIEVQPHDYRRTVISDLLDDGVDLSSVQRFARHATPATTSRYDRRGDRTKRDAARRARVPFSG